jgi:hypothetical protein
MASDDRQIVSYRCSAATHGLVEAKITSGARPTNSFGVVGSGRRCRPPTGSQYVNFLPRPIRAFAMPAQTLLFALDLPGRPTGGSSERYLAYSRSVLCGRRPKRHCCGGTAEKRDELPPPHRLPLPSTRTTTTSLMVWIARIRLPTSVLGLGCVKTRRHSIAIEEVIRQRPFQASNSQSH